MDVLVIGGTGLMGPTLVQKLVENKHRVTCLNRRGISTLAPAIKCDRRDPEALRAVFQRTHYDAVIDMIPVNEDDANTLTTCLENTPDTQVIAISSMTVYLAYARIHRVELGPYQNCPIKETDALCNEKVLPNHHDKPAVEAAYLKAYEHLSILRLPAIYGWPDVSRIKPYVEAVFQGDGSCRLHPTYAAWTHSRASVADCVQAIVLTLGLRGQHIFNVGEQTVFTEAAWCALVWKAAGKQGALIEDPDIPVPFNA
ncbi:MAG: NAD-dependent epimerase/dehydratase family protein, partial [Verrucomicrobiota bacterium]